MVYKQSWENSSAVSESCSFAWWEFDFSSIITWTKRTRLKTNTKGKWSPVNIQTDMTLKWSSAKSGKSSDTSRFHIFFLKHGRLILCTKVKTAQLSCHRSLLYRAMVPHTSGKTPLMLFTGFETIKSATQNVSDPLKKNIWNKQQKCVYLMCKSSKSVFKNQNLGCTLRLKIRLEFDTMS